MNQRIEDFTAATINGLITRLDAPHDTEGKAHRESELDALYSVLEVLARTTQRAESDPRHSAISYCRDQVHRAHDLIHEVDTEASASVLREMLLSAHYRMASESEYGPDTHNLSEKEE